MSASAYVAYCNDKIAEYRPIMERYVSMYEAARALCADGVDDAYLCFAKARAIESAEKYARALTSAEWSNAHAAMEAVLAEYLSHPEARSDELVAKYNDACNRFAKAKALGDMSVADQMSALGVVVR